MIIFSGEKNCDSTENTVCQVIEITIHMKLFQKANSTTEWRSRGIRHSSLWEKVPEIPVD